MTAPTQQRILCVDDDRDLLEGLALRQRRRFRIVTATSGAEGLRLIEEEGPFAVVLSDMRMPGMDGAAFLREVRALTPRAVRMLLTGQADLDAAIAAVNDGFIFRFLTKPCPPEVLDRAFEDALEQYRLVNADRELLEWKLERLTGQLLHAERLATLGTLACGVAHELNNILTIFGILMPGLERCAKEGRPPSTEDVQSLQRIGKHLQTHAHHLLTLGRSRDEPAQRLDLRQVLSETVALLQAVNKVKHVAVQAVTPEQPVWVEASRTRLEQVLVNLMTNAADAIHEVKRQGGLIRLTLSQAGGRAVCRLEDNGCGIAADKLGMIFEPYFTTKPAERGTGLGLPVVKQIVESYGGTIQVQSQPGQGTTFTFELPSRPAQA